MIFRFQQLKEAQYLAELQPTTIIDAIGTSRQGKDAQKGVSTPKTKQEEETMDADVKKKFAEIDSAI